MFDRARQLIKGAFLYLKRVIWDNGLQSLFEAVSMFNWMDYLLIAACLGWSVKFLYYLFAYNPQKNGDKSKEKS